MKKQKEIKGSTINMILGITLFVFIITFTNLTAILFHWSRKVYSIIFLILIPITWSQPILAILGKRTIGYVIADKINNKNKVKDTNSK